MKRIEFTTDSEIYTPQEIKKVLEMSVNSSMLIGNNKGVYYYNCPCSFDIETSSFYRDNGIVVDYKTKRERQKTRPDYNPEKIAIMYVWQFGINGRVIIGRTWEEFFEMLSFISEHLQLDEKRRLICYVHNLSFEFQFMYKWLKWYKVFAIDTRKPIYAISEHFIEFRCSLLLSGYSLANLGEQLQRYPIKKLVGDLDYSLLRHSETPLTEQEVGYCVNDVRVVMAYIQECIENENGITNIPITKTGYVRNYCRKNTLYLPNTHKRNQKYRKLIKDLTISNMQEFNAMQRAFQGGFTHANAFYSGEVLPNVASYDFTSSYPYVMVSEKFPMSRGVKVEVKNKKEFDFYTNNYLCIFDVTFKNLVPLEVNENPLSQSKCQKPIVNGVFNNGRVVSADLVATTITNVDYKYLSSFYKWDSMLLRDFYVYHAEYLPTPLINCILDLYEKKTVLKGVKGKEVEYLKSKEMINSVYGMCVTNPLRDEYTLNDVGLWETFKANQPELSEMLYQHNISNNRFLFYVWGVFVTAYARRNLFTAIKVLQEDYVYSDTDSVKVLNHENHQDYFNAYNEQVKRKLQASANHHNINVERFSPKTIKGVTKTLGLWDFEGVYTRFKTLGAKRYMVESYDKEGKPNALYNKRTGENYPVSITVSGVNKMNAVPYMLNDLTRGDITKMFEEFKEGLHIPPEKTGKLIHTYIDDEKTGILIDYLGNKAKYYEKTGVHLEQTHYEMSIASLYADYLRGLKHEII